MSDLADLTARLRQALSIYAYPEPTWVPSRGDRDGARVHDVLIVGAGLRGLSVALALVRERITNVLVLDAVPEDPLAPVEATSTIAPRRARMDFASGDVSLPLADFRTWHTAAHPATIAPPAGAGLRERWRAYRDWFRGMTDLPVSAPVRITELASVGDGWRVTFTDGCALQTVLARRLVVTAGPAVDGLPPPADVVANVATPLPEALVGRTVAVVGGDAAAFDAALTALAAGATVEHVIPPPGIPDSAAVRWLGFTALAVAYPDLPAPERIRLARRLRNTALPPPIAWVAATAAEPRYRRRLATNPPRLTPVASGVVVGEGSDAVRTNLVLVAAPRTIALARDPLLGSLARHIMTWGERWPAEVPIEPALAEHPLLDGDFAVMPRGEDAPAALRHLYLFGPAALASLGLNAFGLNLLRYGVPRLLEALSRSLFVDEAEELYRAFLDFETAEAQVAQR